MELSNNPSFVVPAYNLVNTQLSFQGSRFDIRIDVNNLLEQYIILQVVRLTSISMEASMNLDLANAGRNIMISTRFRF